MDYCLGMSRVLISESTGAAVYVFSDDHCPPHVHARHRGEGWIARVRFSYISSQIELMSIAPLKNSPLQRTVKHLLADLEAALPLCRRSWWMTKRTACLTNQWAVLLASGQIALLSEPLANAKQIDDATYDPDEQRLRVVFQDGTTTEVRTAP
jgi:hypothetical protein